MWEDSSCEKTVYVGRQFIREDSSLEKTVYVGRQFMWDPKHKSIKVLLYTNFFVGNPEKCWFFHRFF